MINGQRYFTSWSGGKDSALAHYQALQEGGSPACLLSMFEENEEYSRSHSLPYGVIQAQADAMDVPLIIRGASWASYQKKFLELMEIMKRNGVNYGVFGDIDLEDHLEWVQRNCEKGGITSYHPLWKKERRQVLTELLDAGFESVIIVVDENKLPATFLGRVLDEEAIAEIEERGIDACGEEGEFHTVVVDGPLFNRRIPVSFKEVERHEGYAFLPVVLQVG
ncbi:diphthine--ammonia ligase [Alkalicoccus halolimnae]|uniref:Diphthine--ammonia ligase n=1 Tax=Alkalicoccus halolimnae TaxID=1667239 RepID=A0A5C7FHF5_9BACI|nr:diphthine--ammonia ligase [Alkalicoccus halolimnae]TXF86747.1 diphthine--ammonia ligase [Alkalicoccus halolimnae]